MEKAMTKFKRLPILFFSAVLLAACSPNEQAQQSAPATSAPEIQAPINAEISEDSAAKILATELKKHNVPDLECLSMVAESENPNQVKATTWDFAAYEIHNEKCGGDPDISHVRDRYRVTSSGNVAAYDVTSDEYKALDASGAGAK